VRIDTENHFRPNLRNIFRPLFSILKKAVFFCRNARSNSALSSYESIVRYSLPNVSCNANYVAQTKLLTIWHKSGRTSVNGTRKNSLILCKTICQRTTLSRPASFSRIGSKTIAHVFYDANPDRFVPAIIGAGVSSKPAPRSIRSKKGSVGKAIGLITPRRHLFWPFDRIESFRDRGNRCTCPFSSLNIFKRLLSCPTRILRLHLRNRNLRRRCIAVCQSPRASAHVTRPWRSSLSPA
jgi:hypothetical protein